MEKTRLPAFKGKPLIEIPSFIPQIGFIEGDFGKAFLEEYAGRAKTDYGNVTALNVLNCRDSVVKGSNPFAIVLANQILRQEGLRTATQADLEEALRLGIMPLTGTYEDTALVLRTEDDRDYSKNTPLARDLAKKLKARKIKFNNKTPLVIPLTGLELQTTQDNSYGLTFNLREEAEVYQAPILREGGQFKSEDINIKTGLPKKLGDGNRTLYTRDSGLSRLGLNVVLNVYSSYRDLDGSSDNGRVVVVSAEGTSPQIKRNLEEKIRERYLLQDIRKEDLGL